MADLNGLLSGLFSDPESAEKLARLAGILGGGGAEGALRAKESRGCPEGPQTRPPEPAPHPPAFDSAALLFRALPILNEFSEGEHDPKVQLLYALRPYLTGERLDRLEDAILLLKLARIAGSVLELFDGR